MHSLFLLYLSNFIKGFSKYKIKMFTYIEYTRNLLNQSIKYYFLISSAVMQNRLIQENGYISISTEDMIQKIF